jgi:2-succinyl-6-hydroxy-2,4-cyclohexadiene-1-carboxylate synthase
MTGLVLLHGFTGSYASFDGLLATLRRRWPRLPVLCPPLLGHGARPQIAPRSFEQEVDRLANTVRRAGFAGAHLCGYSLGARLALGLLARHAWLFAGATLIGVHPGLASEAERAARVGSDERWCQLLEREGTASFLRAWQAQPLFDTQGQLSQAEFARQAEIRRSHSAAGLQQSLRVLGLGRMPDLRGVPHVLRLRLQLLVGALDAKFCAIGARLAATAPVQLEIVAGAGHNLLLEAPERVSRVLTTALEVQL